MIDPTVRRRRPWQRWLLALLSVALLAFVISQFTSVSSLGADLSGADVRWLAVALALQVAFFLLYGWLYQHGLAAVDVESEALRLVPVLLASIFAKTVLPLTAAPAAAVFIDDATSRGQSGPRTAVGLVVVLIVDLVTALPFVVAGALALVLRSTLVGFALVGTALFAAFIVALVLCLVLAARRPTLLAGLLRAVGTATDRLLVRLGRRAVVPEGWGQRTTDQLVAGVTAVPGHGREIALAACYSLATHVVSLAALAALFLAFGQRLDPAALAAGFSMSIVFFVLSIVPDGIGAVEGAMALVFVALGMTPSAAVVVTVAYRILNVWIPVVVGFACVRRLRIVGGPGAVGAPAGRRTTRVRPPASERVAEA
jgi:uncharacterized protein (TIRG00374 family)